MCSYCLRDSCTPGCPNYSGQKSIHHCSICGQWIYGGEEYIEYGGDYIHLECIPSIRWVINWLGYDIREMKDYEYYSE